MELKTENFGTTKDLGNNAIRMLSAGVPYVIGKFRILLSEETDELNIIVVSTEKDKINNMSIKPRMSNSVTVVACR